MLTENWSLELAVKVIGENVNELDSESMGLKELKKNVQFSFKRIHKMKVTLFSLMKNSQYRVLVIDVEKRQGRDQYTNYLWNGYFWEDMEMGKFKYEIMEYDL